MRIRNHLVAQHFPELEAAYSKGGNDHEVLRVVKECFDPAEVASLSFEAFWNRIAVLGWGKRQEGRVQAKLETRFTPLDGTQPSTSRQALRGIRQGCERAPRRRHLQCLCSVPRT